MIKSEQRSFTKLCLRDPWDFHEACVHAVYPIDLILVYHNSEVSSVQPHNISISGMTLINEAWAGMTFPGMEGSLDMVELSFLGWRVGGSRLYSKDPLKLSLSSSAWYWPRILFNCAPWDPENIAVCRSTAGCEDHPAWYLRWHRWEVKRHDTSLKVKTSETLKVKTSQCLP